MVPGKVPVEAECLSRAVDRLTAAGYTHELRAEAGGLRDATTGLLHLPEDLVVDETVRVEGISDPGDEAIVLAVRDRTASLRGTYVAAFGAEATGADAAMLPRLRTPDASPPTGLAAEGPAAG
jgi:hypothetical protein